jgi:hypothetical protein
MTLRQWAEYGWLRSHTSSAKEIAGLLSIIRRDLADAGRLELSPDWRFGIAYNAALKACTILLHASGYRPEKALLHYRTIQALPLVLGDDRKADAAYLDACRMKRNTLEYESAGDVTLRNAEELMAFATRLHAQVLDWLQSTHPRLIDR